MLGNVSSGFSDLVIIGERIEDGLKSGKIQGASGGQNGAKKFSNFNLKKKESDANVVMGLHQAPLTQVLYYPYSYVFIVASRQHPPREFHVPSPQQPLMIPPYIKYQ